MVVHAGGRGFGHSSRSALGPIASLSLDFLSSTSLDSRITFSRGSQATVVDATGKITYAPNNLLLRSQEFDVAPWQATNAGTGTQTISANGGLSPIGDLTADRLQLDLNGGTTSNDATRRRQAVTVSGGNYTFSVWLRSFDGVSTYTVGIQLASTVSAVTVTGEWQRFYITVTLAAGSVASDIFIRGAQTPTHSPSADLLVWGAQLEAVTYQTTPGTYNATTTAAYYGPRFDYDPVTLAPRGLLVEEQRTNLFIRSEDFTTGWAATRATVSANVAIAPDGTVSADKIVEDTSLNSHFINQPVASVAGGSSLALSIYAKTAGRNFLALVTQNSAGSFATTYFNLSDGTIGTVASGHTASIQSVGNGWYRCIILTTQSATTGTFNVYPSLASVNGNTSYQGDGFSGVLLWGAQLEAGSFATSYIPTVASQVTRTADVATMTGTNFSSWFNSAEGSFVTAADTYSVTSNATTLNACDANAGGVNERIQIRTSATGAGQLLQASSGTINANITSGTLTNNTPYKVAVAIKTDDFAISANGGALGTDNLGQIAAPVELRIGRLGTTEFLNGHIRSITYYPTRLPNATLQSLTS